MNASASSTPTGRVASLHLHPAEPGATLQRVEEIEMIQDKGIRGEPRYFGKISRRTSQPSRRQVSLMEREQIAEHAAALGLENISAGAVRANIETVGIDLVALLGRNIQIGEAILFLYEARLPCSKMDDLCPGLRNLMENSRQGVMAQVVRSGVVHLNDELRLLPPASASA